MELYSETQGEADEGTVEVEGRQRIAGREHLIDAGKRCGEALQRRLHLEQDSRPTLAGETRTAAKLDRVAKSLLGMQQDGLAVEVLASRPARFPKWTRSALHLASGPAPFIVGPS